MTAPPPRVKIIAAVERWSSWSKAPVLKTGGSQGPVGSNPTLSATSAQTALKSKAGFLKGLPAFSISLCCASFTQKPSLRCGYSVVNAIATPSLSLGFCVVAPVGAKKQTALKSKAGFPKGLPAFSISLRCASFTQKPSPRLWAFSGARLTAQEFFAPERDRDSKFMPRRGKSHPPATKNAGFDTIMLINQRLYFII